MTCRPILDDDGLRAVLEYFDRPWGGYRRVRKGVKKRLRRHMRELGCRSAGEYLRLLERDGEIRQGCLERLRVTISRFYRDRALWQRLKTVVAAELPARRDRLYRVWSAGCACGEEAYSFSLLWRQLGSPARLDILASDADPACLRRAGKGVYPSSSLREVKKVDPELVQRYFSRNAAGDFTVSPDLRVSLRWQLHDLLAPPPPGPFHLVFLRNNLLTYYRQPTVARVADRIIERLLPGGVLVIGSHETLPQLSATLTADDEIPYLYRKIEIP